VISETDRGCVIFEASPLSRGFLRGAGRAMCEKAELEPILSVDEISGLQFGELAKPTLTPPPAVPRSGWHSGASVESSIRTITHRQKRCRNKAKSFLRLRTTSGILRSWNGWSFAS
jgi:hypothetical protein